MFGRYTKTDRLPDFRLTFPLHQTQIAFFLENWNEIRSAESMKSIWQQIRVGRHPGFEEGESNVH